MKHYGYIALITVLITALLSCNTVIVRADKADYEKKEVTVAESNGDLSYEAYLNGSSEKTGVDREIALELQSAENITDGVYPNETVEGKRAVLFKKDTAAAEWTVNVKSAGLYHIEVLYCPVELTQADIQMSVYINGKIPFEEAEAIALKRQYADTTAIRSDSYGNDMKSYKEEVFEWSRASLKDRDGIYSEPFYFRFDKGENTLRLAMNTAGVAIGAIRLYDTEPQGSYADYTASVSGKQDNSDGEAIIIQGENIYRTTDTGIYATSDRQSPVTLSSDGSLNSPSVTKLNTVGQSTWKSAGQKLTWKFEVEKSGYYVIGMRVKQNEARGIYSTREFSIDGEVPFSELKQVQVDYGTDWQIKLLGDNEPYRFYLEAGVHTVSMEAVSGNLGAYVKKLDGIVLKLNTLYREIIMITGTSPDSYRDYKIDSEIPDLISRMEQFTKELRTVMEDMQALGIQSSSDMIVAEQLATQLESFIEQPRTIVTRLSNYQDNISSLSSWALSLTQQPLELDYIFVQSEEMSIPRENANMWETLVFRAKSFLSTFTSDYSSISDAGGNTEALEVWVSLGRDQAQIIKEMVDSDFTPQTEIPVNVSLVQQGIVEAIAADRAPDVLMYSGDIVNLAARNALVDLTQMEKFDTVKKRFSENALIPYTYENGVYAFPLTQSFLMLFYRTDIFDEFGLEPPETWEDFYDIIRVLQKNNLTAGVPVGSSTSADTRIFSVLLYQSGGKYYNSDCSQTDFNSETAINAFTKWTEFYAKYRLPQTYTLLTRFRSGEMPVAIDNYSAYSTFSVAAPEIAGLWEMAPIPGTKTEDGSINRTSVSSSLPISVLSCCENLEAAFSFIEWYTSADAQIYYGKTVESVLGTGARYEPANIEALNGMNWSNKELSVLNEGIAQTTYVPEIPASYYVNRNLTNAYRAVTIKEVNPREALYSYNIEINAEIQRKRLELGLE